MKKFKFKQIGIPAVILLAFIVGCTDLEIEETDSVIDESTSQAGVFNGVEDVEASLSNVYNGMNRVGDQANIYAIQEVSTDELLIPTRGTDWGDNGIWRTLHQHTWDANHAYILAAWNNWNSTIFNATELRHSIWTCYRHGCFREGII